MGWVRNLQGENLSNYKVTYFICKMFEVSKFEIKIDFRDFDYSVFFSYQSMFSYRILVQ